MISLGFNFYVFHQCRILTYSHGTSIQQDGFIERQLLVYLESLSTSDDDVFVNVERRILIGNPALQMPDCGKSRIEIHCSLRGRGLTQHIKTAAATISTEWLSSMSDAAIGVRPDGHA